MRLTVKRVEDYEATQRLIVERAEQIIKESKPGSILCKEGMDVEILEGIVEIRFWYDDCKHDVIRTTIEEFCK